MGIRRIGTHQETTTICNSKPRYIMDDILYGKIIFTLLHSLGKRICLFLAAITKKRTGFRINALPGWVHRNIIAWNSKSRRWS